MYQQGLHIPLIRLGRDDRFDQNILNGDEIILRNVRVPIELGGDLWAQVAGCRVGAQRVTEIMDRYGRETTESIWKATLNAYERRCRTLIAQLPQTTLVHEGYIDVVRSGQMRIRVTLTINGDSIVVDYTGSSPHQAGPPTLTLGPPKLLFTINPHSLHSFSLNSKSLLSVGNLLTHAPQYFR